MRFAELNQEGDFTHWETEKLKELKAADFSKSIGGQLLFHNNKIRLWKLELAPFDRLSFREHAFNYSWSCAKGGMVISRNINGRIVLYVFEDEDTGYVDLKGKTIVSDIENTGPSTITFYFLEYLH